MELAELQKQYELNPTRCKNCNEKLNFKLALRARDFCGKDCSNQYKRKTSHYTVGENGLLIEKNKTEKLPEKPIEINTHTVQSKGPKFPNNGFKYCAIDDEGLLWIVNPPDYTGNPIWENNLRRKNH